MPKTFGEILKKVRQENGLTATEMAGFLEIGQSTYSKYENDKTTQICNKEIQEYLKKLNIEEFSDRYELNYWDKQYIIKKSGFSNAMCLAAILVLFIEGILQILQNMIECQFDYQLLCYYVEYHKLKNEIMMH